MGDAEDKKEAEALGTFLMVFFPKVFTRAKQWAIPLLMGALFGGGGGTILNTLMGKKPISHEEMHALLMQDITIACANAVRPIKAEVDSNKSALAAHVITDSIKDAAILKGRRVGFRAGFTGETIAGGR